jgi:hypothetical protein
VHVQLVEGADIAEPMNLPRFNNKDVPGAGFEFLAVDCPKSSPFPDELDLIIWMTMGSGALSRESVEEELGDIDVAVVGPDELVRAALKWQVMLANAVHFALLWRLCYCYFNRAVWISVGGKCVEIVFREFE